MSRVFDGQLKRINSEECLLLELPCCNSGLVIYRIVLLNVPNFVGMHNGQELMQVIRQDAYVPVTSQSPI
ncbi:hypothetical protein TNCV_2553671 [Trichonephila clavipes]|nr:hypothetical protein TNCV_2553671 [Trichonephila clavipes]